MNGRRFCAEFNHPLHQCSKDFRINRAQWLKLDSMALWLECSDFFRSLVRRMFAIGTGIEVIYVPAKHPNLFMVTKSRAVQSSYIAAVITEVGNANDYEVIASLRDTRQPRSRPRRLLVLGPPFRS